jgi:RND family efflux transporter MFP subunit
MREIFMKKWLPAVLMILAAPAALATDAAATLQWSQRVELGLSVSGVVQSVSVVMGDRVKKGQVLLMLDTHASSAKVAESQAAVQRHKEVLAEARRDLGRVQELYNRTVIAPTDLDQAKLRYVAAKASLDEAQARLKQDSQSVEDRILRAPFDAFVVSRDAELGLALANGLKPQTLLVLAKAGEMLARFKLYDTQIGQFKLGQALTVEANGQSYQGKIRSLGLEPLPGKDEATYPVEVVFYPKELLRAGMPAKVRLP